MAYDFRAGLDSDELSGFPSPANPLTAMGIDPDYAQAHPEILEGLSPKMQPGYPGGPPDTSNLPANGSRRPAVPYSGAIPTLSDSEAAKPSPSAAEAGKVAGAGEPTDAEGYSMAGLSQTRKAMQDANRAATEVPTETPQEITDLAARRSKLASPAPRFDASGKELTSTQVFNPDTNATETINPKASRGQKIWRGVRGGLVGLMTGGIPGAVTGAIEPQDIAGGKAYNAPSKPYEQAEQRREQALGATDTGLENARKNWQEAVKARQAQAQEFGKVAGLGKDLTTGATGLINATSKEDKAAIAQKEFDQRGAQADRLGLKGTQRVLFIANGKIPDPRQATEGELALAQATKAFIKQYGRPPQTIDEFNELAQSAKGAYGKEDSKQDQIDAANTRAAMRSAEQHLKALQGLVPHVFDPRAKADLQDQIKTAQDEYQELQDKLKGKQPPAPTPAAVTQAVATVPRPAVPAELKNTPPVVPAAPTAAKPATKPQPAPDGTRIKTADGTVQVKRNGKWVKE